LWSRHCGPQARRLGSSFPGFSFGFGLLFSRRFGVRDTFQVPANPLGNIFRDGAGVSLLFGNTIARQEVDDRFRLDLEFACQFVDSYLVCFGHASYRSRLCRDVLFT
jgi:hypothetical protein